MHAQFGSGSVDHLVVVMLENHSFDNVLGWLYADQGNCPPLNLPPPAAGGPVYHGLDPSSCWNSIPPLNPNGKVPAGRGTSDFTSPNPNPNELFDDMTAQIYGAANPAAGAPPNMSGLMANYATVSGATAASIMDCYDPSQLPTHSWLAKQFAVCDRWFGSSPTETFPNRSFLHAGTSFGRVNGCDGNTEWCVPSPSPYHGRRTVFYALDQMNVPWTVYNDSALISTVRFQFQDEFWDEEYDPNFKDFSDFQQDAANGTLPAYSFIEPSFIFEPNDGHPPHDMRKADGFVAEIWDAVRTSPQWQSILLVIIYDEHGGCYDHVAPPTTAINPDTSVPQLPFDFGRYGPRVPAIVVSPWIQPGTVFRSGPGENEFDHTSVVATIRECLGVKILPAPFQSLRVDAAPTLSRLLTLKQPRLGLPSAPSSTAYSSVDLSATTPLNPVQRAVVAGSTAPRYAISPASDAVREQVMQLATEAHAIEHLKRHAVPLANRRKSNQSAGVR